MSIRYVRASTVAIASFLSLTGVSQAATTEILPGEWTRFTFPRVGQPALDTFTFNASPTGARLSITDAGLSGDRFSVSVNGTSVGNTSPASRGFSCGFDPKNCFTNSLMSNGTFALKNSGNQSIQITTTASAVPGIGGAGFLRAETSFLNLYGDVGARTDFISILNRASQGVRFYEDKFDPATPFTQLFADVTDRSNFNPFGDLMHQITSGVGTNAPQKPVNLRLGYNLPSVIGGAACVTLGLAQNISCPGSPYNFQALDLNDVKSFPLTSGLSDTPTSIIAHELAEASGLTYELGFDSAHNAAIVEQNLVLKDETGGQRDITIGSRSLPKGVDPKRASIGEDTAYYTVSPTEAWTLFPWINPAGVKGWQILVLKSPNSFDIADIKSGIIDTGVPWSGRDIEISLDSVRFEAVPDGATPIPTPALLPGMIGMGVAAIRRRLKQSRNIKSSNA